MNTKITLAATLISAAAASQSYAQMSDQDGEVLKNLCACTVEGGKFDRFRNVSILDQANVVFRFPDDLLGITDRLGIPSERQGRDILVRSDTDRIYFLAGYFPRGVGEVISLRFNNLTVPNSTGSLSRTLFSGQGSSVSFEWDFYYTKGPQDEGDQRQFSLEIAVHSENFDDRIVLKVEGAVDTGPLVQTSDGKETRIEALDLSRDRNFQEMPVYLLALMRGKQASASVVIQEEKFLDAAIESDIFGARKVDFVEFSRALARVDVPALGGGERAQASVSAVSRFITGAVDGTASLQASIEADDFGGVLAGFLVVIDLLDQLSSADFAGEPAGKRANAVAISIASNSPDASTAFSIEFQ